MKKTIALLLSLVCLAAYGQKASKKTLTIRCTIAPATPLPKSLIYFNSFIETSLDPLSGEDELSITDEAQRARAKQAKLKALETENLSLTSGGYVQGSDNADWTVAFYASDLKTTFVNEKPFGELAKDESVFKYALTANVVVSDKTGQKIFEKVLATPTEERAVTKEMLMLNPTFALKMKLTKSPEKQKKLVDAFMTKREHHVLTAALSRAKEALMGQFFAQAREINLSIFSVKGKGFEEIDAVNEKLFDAYLKFNAFNRKKRLPKADLDAVMTEAIGVWNKENTNPIDEQATKGLALNSAFASTWLNNIEAAKTYLAKVPEASVTVDEPYDADAPSQGSMGATVILSFEQSAVNAKKFFDMWVQYDGRMTFQD